MAFLWPASKLRETPFAETSMHFEILSRKKNSQAESHDFFQFFGEDLANVAKPGKNAEIVVHVIPNCQKSCDLNCMAQIFATFATGEMLRCHYNPNTRDF